MKLEDMFKAIEDMRDKASVNTVYGKPVEVGEKVIIPVADIKYGFGLGFGEGPTRKGDQDEQADAGQGGGAGGGIAARPLAVLEITGEGVKVKPVIDEGRIALARILTGAWISFWVAKTLKAILGSR